MGLQGTRLDPHTAAAVALTAEIAALLLLAWAALAPVAANSARSESDRRLTTPPNSAPDKTGARRPGPGRNESAVTAVRRGGNEGLLDADRDGGSLTSSPWPPTGRVRRATKNRESPVVEFTHGPGRRDRAET